MRHTPRPNFARDRLVGGFTLIELILVLLVISVTMALAAPSLRGWSDGAKLRDAGDLFVASARWARAQAILTGTPHVLQVDAPGSTYRVGTANAGETQTTVTPVAGEYGRDTPLPQAFAIQMVSGGESNGTILFHPNGRCTPAVVRITSARQFTVDIASTFPAEPFRIVDPNTR